MELKKRQLEEEERLFDGVKLTEIERKRHDIEKKLYEIALKRRNIKQDTQSY